MPLTPEQIRQAREGAGLSPTPQNTNVAPLAQRIGVAPTASSNIEDTTNTNKATFPSTGKEGILGGAAKVIGNIPESGAHFAKGVFDFFNPVNTYKSVKALGEAVTDPTAPQVSPLDVAKEIPHEAYKAVVPMFIQHLVSGDTEKARETIQNDPVGQLAPLILLARGAAEKAGQGATFDESINKIVKTATTPLKKVGNLATRGAAETLGVTTGTGASSIRTAFNAASEGPESLKTFTDAMRGNINPDEVVRSVEDALENIKNQRRTSYLSKMDKISKNTDTHDLTPIRDTLDEQLNNFGVKVGRDGGLDFSRSSIANNGSARADIQGVYDTLKTWGTKPEDQTAKGIDTLKKQLGDFYSPSGSARAFVQAVKSSVNKLLQDNVKGYSEMTKGYQQTSNLLDDIRSATGAGGRAKADTIFTKLAQAMKGDKEFRMEVLKEIENTGGQKDLMEKISGINMQSVLPKGIIGKGADIYAIFDLLKGAFNPKFIPAMLTTSPRVMGEFVRALGIGKAKAKPILEAINKLNVPTIPQKQKEQ